MMANGGPAMDAKPTVVSIQLHSPPSPHMNRAPSPEVSYLLPVTCRAAVKERPYTVFLPSDATTTIFFSACFVWLQFEVATIQG